MKTQIAKWSFAAEKRYSGVFQQQGRMVLDADWNEWVALCKEALAEALRDLVGSGAPKNGGLQVIPRVPGMPPWFRSGDLYADGLRAQATFGSGIFRFNTDEQIDFPAAPPLPENKINYCIYADVWDRTITHLEDPDLLDPALHGADTCTRTQRMAQIKWAPSDKDPENPNHNPKLGDARLTLTLRQGTAGGDPCDPCAKEVTLENRTGNYLFRLEVHRVRGPIGGPDRITLKWSSENAAEQYRQGTEPPDFKAGPWAYEFFNETGEKHHGVHLPDFTPNRGKLRATFPTNPPDKNDDPFVRRWDGFCALERGSSGWSLANGWDRGVRLDPSLDEDAHGHVAFGHFFTANLAALELKLRLSSSPRDVGPVLENTVTGPNLVTRSRFVVGDHWLVAIRDIHQPGDTLVEHKLPDGIVHHYLKLAEIDKNGEVKKNSCPEKTRLAFPSLTALSAADICFTNKCDKLYGDAEDLQQALTNLCRIEAEDIAFVEKCDTSIYKGKKVENVAQALKLLCDVKAEAVSLPAEKCALFANDQNVAQALNTLCEHKWGCKVTVGEGGDFTKLGHAITHFLKLEARDLCFCLLPGDHPLENFTVKKDPRTQRHFSLCGCGPGSRLKLTGQLSFENLDWVALHKLSVETEGEGQLIFLDCHAVNIEECRILGRRLGTAPLEFRGASTSVTLEKNLVRGRQQSIIFQELDSGENNVNLFAAPPAEDPAGFTQRISTNLAKNIANLKPDRRADFTARLGNRLRQLEERQAISEPLKASFQDLVDGLGGTRRVQTGSLTKTLTNIRTVYLEQDDRFTPLQEPGPALIFDQEAAKGDVTLVDNHIDGILSIYGYPDSNPLTEDELRHLHQWLVKLTIEKSVGRLAFTRNRFVEVQLGVAMKQKIRDFLATDPHAKSPQTLLAGVFRAALLTDNLFETGKVRLLAKDCRLDANIFDLRISDRAAVIGHTGLYLKNHGDIIAVGTPQPPASSFYLTNVTLSKDNATRQTLNTLQIRDAISSSSLVRGGNQT